MAEQPSYEALRATCRKLEARISTYSALVENSPDLFYRADTSGRLTYVSPSVFSLSGYTVEEATGMKLAEELYLCPDERRSFLAELEEKGRVEAFEARLKRKDGSTWWASTNAHLLKDSQGNISGVEGIVRDVSEKKDAELALKETEERFRLAFHTSPDAINLNRVSDGLYIDINVPNGEWEKIPRL